MTPVVHSATKNVLSFNFERQLSIILCFASCIALVNAFSSTSAPHPPDIPLNINPNDVHLRIIHFNDVYKLDHLPKLKGYLDGQRKQQHGQNNVICTLGGDFFSPSILSSLDQGHAMVTCLSELGVDYACLGNHEADVGEEAFVKNVDKFHPGTIINSNFPVMPLSPSKMPKSVKLNVTSSDSTNTKRIALLGLLETSPNLYLPGAFCDSAVENAIPIPQCLKQLKRELLTEKGDNNEEAEAQFDDSVDLVVPITHQEVQADTKLAQEFGCPQQMPIILGGHEHEPHDIPTFDIEKEEEDEEKNDVRCRVLKAGIDAEKAIVIDLIWRSRDTIHHSKKATRPEIQHMFVDIATLSDSYIDQNLQALVDEFQEPLQRLDKKVLKMIEKREDFEHLSSIGVRKQQTTVGSLICTALRKALKADVAVLPGGCIRGNRDYTKEKRRYKTFKDLLIELPYDTETVLMPLPGHVLEAAIDYSRNEGRKIRSGGFLQCCNKIEAIQNPNNGEWKLIRIRGDDFNPNKMYNVALCHNVLTGMDDIKPLVEYAKSLNPSQIPHIDAARPAKELVLQVYHREIWLSLGSFDEIDVDGTNCISFDNLKNALACKLEVDPTDEMVQDSIRAFDCTNNGVVTRQEYEACMHAVKLNRFDLSPSECSRIGEAMNVVRYIHQVLSAAKKERGHFNAVRSLRLDEAIFKQGDVICKQGEEGDSMYYCEEGTVDFIVDGKHVGKCYKGGAFGELALLYGSKRAATCIASSNCRLWKIDQPAFRRLSVQATRQADSAMEVI